MTTVDKRFCLAHNARQAEQRIRPHIRTTPLEYSPYLSRLGNCNVYLKLENQQITGSFKYRGASNFILSLSEDDLANGVITASSGNHARAVTTVLKRIGGKGTIVLPENASKAKVADLASDTVDLIYSGTDIAETEKRAREIASEGGRTYIPPYNHIHIVSGQASIGIELERQLEDINAVLVPVGGGGLASGIAGYLKHVNESVQIIGCQPSRSPVMCESVKAGEVVTMDSPATLADGSAGGIEDGSITFDICKELLDDFIVVTEDEIRDAIILMLEQHQVLIEGAAALSVASFVKSQKRFAQANVVLIISGHRIGLSTLRQVLE